MKFLILASLLASTQAVPTAHAGDNCTLSSDCVETNACCGTSYSGDLNVCSGPDPAKDANDAAMTCNNESTPNPDGSSTLVLAASSVGLVLATYIMS